MEISVKLDSSAAQAALKKAPSIMHATLAAAVQRGAKEIEREARRRAPKDQSTLTQSILARQIKPLEWEVAPGVRYALFVERGTRFGSPPLSTLLAWVRRRGLRPNVAGETERDIAFKIRRAIQRRGVPAQSYMLKAYEAKRERVEQLLNAAVQSAVSQIGATA